MENLTLQNSELSIPRKKDLDESGGVKIQVSITQPTGLSKGDFWYKITGTIQ